MTCPRCGANAPLGKFGVCDPCAALCGWDPPCLACQAEDAGADSAGLSHVETCAEGRPATDRGLLIDAEALEAAEQFAPRFALSAAKDAFDDAIARKLDSGQIVALISDAVWKLGWQDGYGDAERHAVEAFRRGWREAAERIAVDLERAATDVRDRAEEATTEPGLREILPHEANALMWAADDIARGVPLPEGETKKLTEEERRTP